ncbi:hypothetical protein Tco_1486959 [Tanacetum coccineum]
MSYLWAHNWSVNHSIILDSSSPLLYQLLHLPPHINLSANTANANVTDTAYLCVVDTGFAPGNVEKDVYTSNNGNGKLQIRPIYVPGILVFSKAFQLIDMEVNRYGSAISTNDQP